MTQFINSTINSVINVAIPYALESVTHAVVHNPKMRNAALSLACIGGGLALIKGSGVARSLQSRISGTPNPHARESWKATFCRWGAAAVGAAGIVLGAVNLVKEFALPQDPAYPVPREEEVELPVPAATAVAETAEEARAVCPAPENHVLDPKQQCEKTIADLRSCPEFDQLWKEVEKGGPFTMECVSDKQAHLSSTNSKSRLINIVQTDPEIETTIPFELSNLRQSDMFNRLNKKKCYLSADEYARKNEIIEYESGQQALKITYACKHLIPNSELYRELFSVDLETISKVIDLKTQLKGMEKRLHTDLYRMHWYRTCEPKLMDAVNWLGTNAKKWDELSLSSDPYIAKNAQYLVAEAKKLYGELYKMLDKLKR